MTDRDIIFDLLLEMERKGLGMADMTVAEIGAPKLNNSKNFPQSKKPRSDLAEKSKKE